MSEEHEPQPAQTEEPSAPDRSPCRKALSFLPRLGLMLGIVLLPGWREAPGGGLAGLLTAISLPSALLTGLTTRLRRKGPGS